MKICVDCTLMPVLKRSIKYGFASEPLFYNENRYTVAKKSKGDLGCLNVSEIII